MKVKWLGHSSFLITSESGLKIITDPYPQGGGLSYTPINETADIVIISHSHADHNTIAPLSGKPQILTGTGVKTARGIQFRGVATCHDDLQGKERGSNTAFCFAIDGINLCHLGDLGHRLSQEQIAEIGSIDILFIPIGGVFTIDAKMAGIVSDDLKPKVIMPMHYKSARCSWPLNTVEDFVVGKQNVKKVDFSEVEFKAGQLPEVTETMVLQPSS